MLVLHHHLLLLYIVGMLDSVAGMIKYPGDYNLSPAELPNNEAKDIEEIVRYNDDMPEECRTGVHLVYTMVKTNRRYLLSKGRFPVHMRKRIQNVIALNEDMPDYCQTDICRSQVTHNERKGEMDWPNITIGQEIKLRCPYSFKKPIYATRVCSVNGSNAWWTTPNYDTVCPDPPLAELIKELDQQANATRNESDYLYYENVLQQIVDVMVGYKGTPVNRKDVSDLLEYLFRITDVVVDSAQSVSVTIAHNIATILDELMHHDLKMKLSKVLTQSSSYTAKLNQLLTTMPAKINITNIGADGYRLNLSSIAVFALPVKNTVNITHVFKGERGQSAMFELYLQLPQNATVSTAVLGLVISREARLLMANSSWETTLDYTLDTNTSNHILSVTEYDEIGHLILISASQGDVQTIEQFLSIDFYYDICQGGPQTDDLCMDPLISECAKSPLTFPGQPEYQSDLCTTYLHTHVPAHVGCHCTGLGAFGLFAENNRRKYMIKEITTTLEPLNSPNDISVFLGFPYSKELTIVGTVLAAISLLCLIVTVSTYGAFRRTRSGSPTTILLNLCVAMIVLYILLLSIQAAGTLTITGCTVSNVLRYYLVFVTLLWNGIEAVNMYLMLIKVFNWHISRFALKTGIIAWGLPMIMVAICFAVNTRAFKGQYAKVPSTHQCQFKCQLRNGTLYYGYIIPMAVIIIHNLIIFGLVLRIIMKHSNKLGMSQKKNKLMQLVGAVATLVLLGVPWLFSAFGAIDANKNEDLALMEGIFQVIFVVFVNLQGIFIFAFHCVRNSQVRESWSNLASSVGRSSTMTSNVSTNNTSGEGSCKNKDHLVTELIEKKN